MEEKHMMWFVTDVTISFKAVGRLFACTPELGR